MKLMPVFLLCIVFVNISCRNSRKGVDKNDDTPIALQENNSSTDFYSKRSYEDILEHLYSEYADKNPSLKSLEKEIHLLENSKTDSISNLILFQSKNENYYHSADAHLALIKDSILKNRVKDLINSSNNKYKDGIMNQTDLLATINEKSQELADLHNLLKIIKTIPLIEKYQQDKMPDPLPLKGYIHSLDETIQTTNALIKN